MVFENWSPVARLESAGPGEIIAKWNMAEEVSRQLRDGGAEARLLDALADPVASATWV